MPSPRGAPHRAGGGPPPPSPSACRHREERPIVREEGHRRRRPQRAGRLRRLHPRARRCGGARREAEVRCGNRPSGFIRVRPPLHLPKLAPLRLCTARERAAASAMALRLLCNAVVRSGGPKIGRATLPAADAPALAGKICGADLKADALPLLPKGGAALGTSARGARVCPGKSPATTPATAGPRKADQGAVSAVSWFAGTSPRPTSGATAGSKISADVQAAIPPSIYNTSAAKAPQITTFQAVGVTWIAGSCQNTLKALIPFPAKHSPSRLFSTKAPAAAAKPG